MKNRLSKKMLLLAFIFFKASTVHADHDASFRLDLNGLYTLHPRWQVLSYVFIQADHNMSDLDYLEWAAGLNYQTSCPWISFLLSYQQGFTKIVSDHWALEQRPSINMNATTTLLRFKISNQIRYEHRFRPGWNDFRIKNTLSLSRPDIGLQPHVGWELYYENGDKALMLSRVKFGISENVTRNIAMGPYVRVDFSNAEGRWTWTRGLFGFQVTLKY